jgi:type I restriction enzyme S subunit
MTNLVSIEEVAEINPPALLDIKPHSDELVPFVPMAAVGEDGTITTVQTRPFGEVAAGYTQFCAGDVLLAKITPCMENGKAALVEDIDGVGCGSTEFHVLRPKKGVFPRYLFHSVWNPFFRREAVNNMTGSAGQKRVPRAFFQRYKFPLPLLDEQKRIAAILDKADGVRRKRQQALRMSDCFLRSVFLDLFGDPTTNPKGWAKGTIRDLVTSVNYGTSQKSHSEKSGTPVLRMNNITYEGGWNFSELKYSDLPEGDAVKYLVQKGELLFNRTNSRELVGKTAVYREEKPMAYAGYLVRAVAKPDADAEYIAAYLNSTHGKAVLMAMCKSIIGMANINAQEMLSIPIHLPPLRVQKRFGDIVRSTANRMKIRADANREAEALFSVLQHRAFRGEF